MHRGLACVGTVVVLFSGSCGEDAAVGGSTTTDGSSTTDPSTTSGTTFDDSVGSTGGPDCPAGWFDNAWSRRALITVDNAGGVAEEGFVVLVDFAGFDLEGARLDGLDLRFVSDTGERLPFDLDSFDSAVGGVAWVRIPQLMAGSGTPGFYVYFGNEASSTAEKPDEVWADAAAIWHMGQVVDGVQPDDRGGPLEGMSVGTTSMAGQISMARRFDGTDTSRIDFGDGSAALASGWPTLSMSLWVYPDYDADADWTTAGKLVERGNAIVGGQLRRDDTQDADLGMFEFELGFDGDVTQAASIELPRQAWSWIGIDYDGSTLRTYLDGNPVDQINTAGGVLGSGGGNLIFGGDADGFNGLLDEVQLYESSKAAGWYLTQYRNMTGALVSYGAVEVCE